MKSIVFFLAVLFSTYISISNIFANDYNFFPPTRNTQAQIPDISVIGSIEGKISTSDNDSQKDKIILKEVEFAYQGYLYPNIRSDIFFSMHKHGDNFQAEICEGYLSFLKIIHNLNMKIGKIHVDFGKINKIHNHERPYITQPIVLNNFLGEHGFIAEGVNFSYLMPTNFFLQLDLGSWYAASSHSHEENEEHNEFNLANKLYTSKLWSSFPITNLAELELGLNYATGMGSHYKEHRDDVNLYAVDFTLKYWPSAFKRLIFQTELIRAVRIVPLGDLDRYGYYSYIGYQLSKYWVLGARLDFSQNIFPQKIETSSYSGIITRNFTETTKIRAQYTKYIESDISEGYIQFVFGIGPHSHPLQ